MTAKKSALVLVDIQNDFCTGGALEVKSGEDVVPVANRIGDRFDRVVATQDWHPPDHGSFASNHEGKQPFEKIDLHGLEQILWPPHCVQGTRGAEFHPDLDVSRVDKVFQKGTDPTVDSYSGFHDNGHRKSTGLAEYLRAEGVTDVYVMGLATDVCVKYTALDARAEGFATHLVEDGCRGVELTAGDVAAAIAEMERAGVRVARSDDIVSGPAS